MKKFISTVTNGIKIIKLVAAFADALSAGCTAFSEKWTKHFPEDAQVEEADA